MDNYQNQPLPRGVGTWPQAPPSHLPVPQIHSYPQSYHPPDISSTNNSDSAANIESAVQEAVLHAQELETQQVIQNQRHANTTSEPTKYGEDLLLNHRDPNALKEHLLKMTADHRAEMANKRGKPLHPNNGNVEIGNGYGVPGGGAYYAANLPSAQTNKPRDESDKAKCANDLPDFLKQRLRARGILKDETTMKNSTSTQNATELQVDSQESQNKAQELPAGWVEAKDPTTGAPYFYNQSTGVTQWDRPCGPVNTMQHQVSPSLPENWEEATDKSTGHKYYYNTKTHATQWEPPTAVNTVVTSHAPTNTAVEPVAQTADIWNSQMQRCSGCGGWGIGLVQPWGYCNHCTRIQNIPFQQYPSYPNNVVHSSGNNALKPQGNVAAKDRVVGLKGVQPRAADTTAAGPLFQQRPYPSPGAVLRKNAEVATHGKKRGGMAPITKRGDGSDGLGEAD
nr:unnamed protein product [Digitaria exilis]